MQYAYPNPFVASAQPSRLQNTTNSLKQILIQSTQSIDRKQKLVITTVPYKTAVVADLLE